MRVFVSILGIAAGLVLAMICCEPLYDRIWPGATDKREGGLGYFVVFMLAPLFMVTGGIVGALVGRKFAKRR